MGYVEKLLSNNEQILFRTRRHFFVIFSSLLKEILILAALIIGYFAIGLLQSPYVFFFRIAFVVMGGITILSMIFDLVRWSNEEYVVTSRRVIQCSGIVNKKVLDSSLSKINDVIMEQSFLGRMFNYGTIKILTATEEVINLLDKISAPMQFKHAMLNAKADLEPSVSGTAAAHFSPTQLLEELAHLKSKNMISEEEYQEKRKEVLKRL